MSSAGLPYEIIGEGEPVLFLHGFTGTRETWRETCSYLSGYQCILVDLPGHGEADSTISSMKDCCTLLAELLDKLGIKKRMSSAILWEEEPQSALQCIIRSILLLLY